MMQPRTDFNQNIYDEIIAKCVLSLRSFMSYSGEYIGAIIREDKIKIGWREREFLFGHIPRLLFFTCYIIYFIFYHEFV